ncbi:MAG TPA: DUF3754 domain-containing protein [Thermoguttaceae bacterium]|nr:DUF3754 domain-containing protein [Thermoguttaceae bacterium]
MQADPSLAFLETRERFLPIPTPLILERVLEDPRFSDEQRDRFRMLVKMTQARFHFEFLDQIEQLKVLYDPFDPDRDTLPLCRLSPQGREAQFAELKERFRQLLTGGNYVELTREQLGACLELQPFGGLAVRVDLDQYKDLLVFYRGLREEERRWGFLLFPFCKRCRTIRVFKRVALLVRTVEDGEDVVLLKLFKDVVLEDVKMITPHVRVQMRVFDKLKIGSTVVGSLFAPIFKLMMAAAFSTFLFVIVLAGCIGAFIKGVFSFLSSKTKYMQTLSTSLYFQNQANNASVLTRLVDAAEAEESKELLLAYFILYIERDRDYTMDELDQRVELWLRARFDVEVDFEVDDAVRKLIEKDLIVQRVVEPAPVAAAKETSETEGPEGPEPRRILKVYDLPSSLRRLDEWWDNYFRANNGGDPSNDRLADGDWPPFPEGVRRNPDSPQESAGDG